jgi:hypothetical protein
VVDRKGNENRNILAINAKSKPAAPAKRSRKLRKTCKDGILRQEIAKENAKTEPNPPQKALSPLKRAEFYE